MTRQEPVPAPKTCSHCGAPTDVLGRYLVIAAAPRAATTALDRCDHRSYYGSACGLPAIVHPPGSPRPKHTFLAGDKAEAPPVTRDQEAPRG